MTRDGGLAGLFAAAFCAVIFAIAPSGCAENNGAGESDALALLKAQDGKLQTTHSLPFLFEAEDGYALTEVSDRTDVFSGVPYIISRAAFIGEGAAIMIHAETVADKSGASNYDDLPLADWPAPGFRSEGVICTEITEADIEGESDPEWLIENGFSMIGSIAFAQYFLSSLDHNDEIVISLLAGVPSCGEQMQEDRLDALKTVFQATPL